MNQIKIFITTILIVVISVFSACKKESVTPTLKTSGIQDITYTTATSGGEITDNGGAPVTARGICWSTSTKPTIADNSTNEGSGSGSFVSTMEELTEGTTYYVRSYATNGAGVGYGDEFSFKTTELALATLTSTVVTEITYTSGISGGDITNDGGSEITSRGIVWSTMANPTTESSHTSNGTGTGSFISTMTDLLPGTTYYIRAYATNLIGTAYGNEVLFNTASVIIPTLTTTTVTELTTTTAKSGGNITDNGGGAITARGICLSISANPTTSDITTADGAGTGIYESSLTDLTPGTTYYVRAYATNSAGTAYGNEVSFNTVAVIIPTLSTTTVTAITTTTAKSGGNITDSGGGTITARGICLSISANPTISDITIVAGTGTGLYESNLTDLTPGTTYYVRAYATNSAGTAYGNQVNFTTTAIVLSTLTTATVTNITSGTAISGGNITNAGGGNVTARGVCWSTTGNPTIANNHTTDESGTGSFASNLIGLTEGTTYYVRSYATNAAGTAYGNQVSFTTILIVLPTLTTTVLSEITSTTARTGGNISNTGGGAITAKGVCWSTSENPDTDDNSTVVTAGTSTFVSNITGLTDGTVYYVRSYATNSAGTAYGNQIAFITPVTDIEGNVYKTAQIGTQIWMAENLKVTRLNDNTSIPIVPGDPEWIAMSTPAYSWLSNNSANKDLYGANYNWFAVNTGKLCPDGWHVGTDAEYNTMEMYLGIAPAEVNLWGFRGTDEGTKLKGTTTWTDGGNGTNSSGFNALAGGYRQWDDGSFPGVGVITYFWTASDDTENGHPTVGWYRRVDNNETRIHKGATEKEGGKYVRCLKD